MKNLSIKDIKALRTTPARFEWAVTYLAFGESGTGLEPVKFDLAMQFAKEWKGNMVHFLTGKKDYVTQKEMTREDAIIKCDEMFKRRYEAEVAAHNSPTINTYFTREVGAVEFGRNAYAMVGNGIDENGMAHLYEPRDGEQDSPITTNPTPYTTFANKRKNYAQLLSYLAKGHSGTKVLKNAKVLLDNGALTKGQMWDLRMAAQDMPAAIRKVRSEGVEINV